MRTSCFFRLILLGCYLSSAAQVDVAYFLFLNEEFTSLSVKLMFTKEIVAFSRSLDVSILHDWILKASLYTALFLVQIYSEFF